MQSTDSVKVYDRHGELLYEKLDIASGRKSYLNLDDIPTHLQSAFIAIEDKRFYEHSGVDLRAVFRAIWQNVSEGEVVSGGSTITQQLVRNIIGINKERTFRQKLKETIIAFKVSKFLEKDEVFELYLNSIYFGGLAYGVEAASWQYFNKSVTNLDLAESAFLAGLPQAPNRLNPFNNFEGAKDRQLSVLNAMLSNGRIDQEVYQSASDEYITLKRGAVAKKAPHFVDYVISYCGSNGGSDCRSNNGLNRIDTTLDYGLQRRVETILESDLTFLSHLNIENVAAVILNPRSGEILAMVGSVDYSDSSIDGEVNVATSLRQPGSSIKPLLYAFALENGFKIDSELIDEPVQFKTADGLPYSPKNFDLKYHGKVTLAGSLAQSLNVPTVKLLDKLGVRQFLSVTKLFGLATFDQNADHYGLSLALGSAEVKLLELANAYSVFANNGKRSDVRALLNQSVDSYSVLNSDTAKAISAILSSNELRLPAFGEENPLKFSFPVAAKTGTTRNFRDNWTLGYTDDYVVGVWVGNSDGEVMQGVSGISGAGPIFHKIMNILHEETGTSLTVDSHISLPVSENSDSHLRRGDDDPQDFRIVSPFANDVYLYDPSKSAGYQKIKLEASERARWTIDGQFLGEGDSVLWPLTRGQHEVKAFYENLERRVDINVR